MCTYTLTSHSIPKCDWLLVRETCRVDLVGRDNKFLYHFKFAGIPHLLLSLYTNSIYTLLESFLQNSRQESTLFRCNQGVIIIIMCKRKFKNQVNHNSKKWFQCLRYMALHEYSSDTNLHRGTVRLGIGYLVEALWAEVSFRLLSTTLRLVKLIIMDDMKDVLYLGYSELIK